VKRFDYIVGSAASGIDFPALEVDLKVTSIRQPQSSCPFRSASQKVYGLGYNLLVFVYDKSDDPSTHAALLNFHEAIFIERERTADYQTTRGLLGILERGKADGFPPGFVSVFVGKLACREHVAGHQESRGHHGRISHRDLSIPVWDSH
jgi:hypothetical protein